MTGHWKRLWLLPAFVALAILFFHRLALTNLILGRGDVLLYFYPYWDAAAEALRAGRIPFWNPDLFMGAPFLANSQVGFFYPFNWPGWLLLETPQALKLSIGIHLIIAASGAYLCARRLFGNSRQAAFLSAILFAFGGYLTAQVEHINQFQALAWLPWFLVALAANSWRKKLAALSMLFALQLLAGHTQSVFITGIGLAIWQTILSATDWLRNRNRSQLSRKLFRIYAIALGGAVFGLALAAVQLLPTIELVTLSSRSGGLSAGEALAFSWHPLVIARSLLPSLDSSLFTEYVALLPLTGLLLATTGANIGWRKRNPFAIASLLLILAGLFLAVGQFNPLNWALFQLPGFNLFRAPARFLIFYALGMALLAGNGLDFWHSMAARPEAIPRHRSFRLGIGLIALLIVVASLSVPLAALIPPTQEITVRYPSWNAMVFWVAELVMLWLLIGRMPDTWRRRFPALIITLCLLSLYVASRSLPYHTQPTAPEAYQDLRPASAYLTAATRCIPELPDCSTPAGRMLSLSDTFFDPGDLAELETIYGKSLPGPARFDLVSAVKQMEIVAPNLPLSLGIPSVDGFDGGILPLASYSRVVRLILPEGVSTSDGRLREHLDVIPEERWLDLFNARYLITDRVGDDWREGVFFDLHHPVTLEPGEEISIGYLPDFEATALWLWAEGNRGRVSITLENGVSGQVVPQPFSEEIARVQWDTAQQVRAIRLTGEGASWTVLGMTLVNEEDGSFRDLVLGAYRAIYEGDVKIYENLDVLPRAFMVYNWTWTPDHDSALAVMADPGFEPEREAVIIGAGENSSMDIGAGEATVQVTVYDEDVVRVAVASNAPGLLLLTDAHYPGWTASVNGQPSETLQVDGMFRGVMVASGSAEVVFRFESQPFQTGRIVTLVALALWLGLVGSGVSRHRNQGTP